MRAAREAMACLAKVAVADLVVSIISVCGSRGSVLVAFLVEEFEVNCG